MIRQFNRLVVCSEKSVPEIMAEMFAGLSPQEKGQFLIRIGGYGTMHTEIKCENGEVIKHHYPLDVLLAEIC